jgi:prophage regulatory protein
VQSRLVSPPVWIPYNELQSATYTATKHAAFDKKSAFEFDKIVFFKGYIMLSKHSKLSTQHSLNRTIGTDDSHWNMSTIRESNISDKALKLSDYEDSQFAAIVIRLPKTLQITGFCKATLYAKINPKNKYYDPTFPKPIAISQRSRGWPLGEVLSWVQTKIAERDAAQSLKINNTVEVKNV